MPARRFRRHSKRRFRKRAPRFVRRVKRAEIRNSEVRKAWVTQLIGETFNSGDGTSRELTIWSPLTGLVQGTERGNFTGDYIYPTKVVVRGVYSIPVAFSGNSYFVRWTFFWSRIQANYAGAQVFNSTTTAAAGPTQVPPFANPSIFATTSSSAPYPWVSETFADQFDVTNVHVIKTFTKRVNPGGATSFATGLYTQPFKHMFRYPKRKVTWQNIEGSSLATAPNFPLVGNYYIIFQVYAGAGAVNPAQSGTLIADMSMIQYFKQLS